MNVWLKDKIGFLLTGYIVMILCAGCSTEKNTPATRAYHEFTTRYNIYYNAERAYNEILEEQAARFSDNYSVLLPFYPGDKGGEKSLPGGPFDVVIEKTTQAIRDHSITAKPRRDPTRRHTKAYRQWLQQEEFNPFIKNAWLLLGKAHLQNHDHEQALAVFYNMQRIYKDDPTLITETDLWLMRTYTAMGRIYEAEQMAALLEGRRLPPSLDDLFREISTYYLIRKRAYREAIPGLRQTIAQEKSAIQQRRLQFLLAQCYTMIDEDEKAFHAYESVKGLSTPFMVTLHATVSQYGVAREEVKPDIRKALEKMRKRTDQEDALGRINDALAMKQGDGASSTLQREEEHSAPLTPPAVGEALHSAAEMHESLYQKAYQGWQAGDTLAVRSSWELFQQRYPTSGLTPQLLLLNALSYAQTGNEKETGRYLTELLERHPTSQVAPLAESIMEGLSQGRVLIEHSSPGRAWSLTAGNLINRRERREAVDYSSEKEGTHQLLLTFNGDSLNRERLLFTMANFNFTRFRHRSFILSPARFTDSEALIIHPFSSFIEASQYIEIMRDDSLFLHPYNGRVTPLIISEENLSLLQDHGRVNDYRNFYGDHLATPHILPMVRVSRADRAEKIPQQTEKIVPLERQGAILPPPREGAVVTPPLNPEKRRSPEELRRELERKQQKALQQEVKENSGMSRKQQLREREKLRQEKIRERERELRERERKRKAALRQRERERAEKIRKR